MATFAVAYLMLHHVATVAYAIGIASAALGIARRFLVPKITVRLLAEREVVT